MLGQTFAVTFVILGLLIGFPALWVMCRGFWPRAVDAARENALARPVRHGLFGAAITAGCVLVSLVLSAGGGPGGVAIAALWMIWFTICSIGTAGMASHIGERVIGIDADRPLRATLVGGACFVPTYLLPILGWVGIMPLSWIVGGGAAASALLRRRQQATQPQPAPQPTPVAVAPPVAAPIAPPPAPAPAAQPAAAQAAYPPIAPAGQVATAGQATAAVGQQAAQANSGQADWIGAAG